MTGGLGSRHDALRTGDHGGAGAHASGWALRWRKRAGVPVHAALAVRSTRPFRIAIWILTSALIGSLGLFGGTAYAYFSASGSGTGHATVASLDPVVVEQATAAPGDLYPGEKAPLSLRITNPNDVALTLVGVSEAGTGTTVTVTPATPSCTGSTGLVGVTSTVATGLSSYTIKAHAKGPTTLVVATGATMGTASPNACQTKSFHIKVTVTVRT